MYSLLLKNYYYYYCYWETLKKWDKLRWPLFFFRVQVQTHVGIIKKRWIVRQYRREETIDEEEYGRRKIEKGEKGDDVME